ncbi:MAG: hypothetical protein ABI388_05660, partial [Bacteroidia bacterium]
MNRKIKIALFIIVLIFLGFLRENLFFTINAVLYNKYFSSTDHLGYALEPFIALFSYNTIYIAKWFITPFFAFVYWFTQKQFLLFIFHEKKTTIWLSMLYLSLFLLAGIFFVAGWAFGNITAGYTFSRLF